MVDALKDQPLALREVRVDGTVERSDQLVVLQPFEYRWGLIGETIPDRVVELHLALAPGVASQAGRCLQDHELAGPGREPRRASIRVELGENGHERVVGGLNAQVIHLLRRSRRQGRAASHRFASRYPNEHRMEPSDGFVAHRAFALEVAQPACGFRIERECVHQRNLVDES